MFLHHALDILDHDNGVVDDDADGEHHRQQRDCIRRISDHLQYDEGADQAYRDSKRWNESCAHVAEKQEDHNNNEDERLDERLLDFLYGCGDKSGWVVGDLPGHILWKAFGELRDAGAYGPERLDRVCSRRLKDGHDGCRPAVKPSIAIEIGCAKLKARHVAEAERRPVRICADDDFLEFGDGSEAAFRLDVQLKLLIVRNGRAPMRPTAACAFCD